MASLSWRRSTPRVAHLLCPKLSRARLASASRRHCAIRDTFACCVRSTIWARSEERRVGKVTGVQTCALPIWWHIYFARNFPGQGWRVLREDTALSGTRSHVAFALRSGLVLQRETRGERDAGGAAPDDVALVRGEICQRHAMIPVEGRLPSVVFPIRREALC